MLSEMEVKNFKSFKYFKTRFNRFNVMIGLMLQVNPIFLKYSDS